MATASRRRADGTQQRIDELGPWFHNIHLPDGTQTAPAHGFGDFPRNVWERFESHLPTNLSGWTALDVGCNAGFYSFELARRGALITAVDSDPHYLRQARWAAEQFHLQHRIRLRLEQVYRLAHDDTTYDLVWFMGVFYHLRYPLLALDILARKTRRMMIFQTMTMPGDEVAPPPQNIELQEREQMLQAGWPKMGFIEKRVANDPTNWWAPNHACVEAMLRSCGLRVREHPLRELYVCVPGDPDPGGMRELNDLQYGAATSRRPSIK